MKKKLLTLLTVFALVLSLCPTALAADEKEYFEDQEHADVNFEDMEYVHMELEDIQAAIDEVKPLLDDAANAAEVEEKYEALVDTMDEIRTMATLINIRKSQDVYDTEAAEEYQYCQELYTRAIDALYFLMKDIINSPCAAFLVEQFSEEDIEYLKNYGGISEEEIERNTRETELVDSYYVAVGNSGNYPIEVAGTTTTLAEAEEALDAALAAFLADRTEENYAIYTSAYYDLYIPAYEANLKALNAACAEIYLDLVALRKEVAAEEGYDNYMDYVYEYDYSRDYTPADIRTFEDAVKEYIPEFSGTLASLVSYDSDNPIYSADYSGDVAFQMMKPYVGQVSSEMEEAFNYMLDHHLYDYGYGEGTKDGNGFTTTLPLYNAPYTFNTPSGTLYDFSTAVHEFGHYNRHYYTPSRPFEATDGYDQAETHSQGFELIFTQFYDEIFGENSQAALNYLMANLTGALTDGCLHDELQQYAFSTDNLTVEALNAEYNRLCIAYGNATEEDDGNGYYTYGWVYVPHTFERPGYYISYASSVAGAFAFWLDAQENGYDAAEDAYLTFASLPAEMGYREGLAEAGVDDPLTAEYVEALADAIWDAMDIDGQMHTIELDTLFTDMTADSWFAEAVYTVYAAGLMQGSGDGSFNPSGTASRAQAVTTLYNLAADGTEEAADAGFTDLTSSWYKAAVNWAAEEGIANGTGGKKFNPNGNITRQEYAAMVYHLAANLGLVAEDAEYDLSSFKDAAAVSAWAAEAMGWCVEAGILQGTSGNLNPAKDITRAEMAVILANFLMYGAGAEAAAE